jgi:hypothetical protein
MKKLTFFILGVAFSHSLAYSQGYQPKGIYFLRLQYENAVKVAKIMKD